MVRVQESKLERPKTKTVSKMKKNKQSTRVVSCQVVQDKLISQLNDGREISIDINLLSEWGVLNKNIKSGQLKNPKIHSEGRYIYFPEIDDTLPTRIISEGLFKSCWEK